MRKRILGSLAVVAAGAGLSFGQGPGPGMMMPGGPGMMMPGGPGMGGPGMMPGGPGMMMPGGPGMGGPGMMMPGGPGMGGPEGGLTLSNGQPIIPPPLVGGMLNQSDFGPPGPEGGPGGGGGRGVWEQGGTPNFWTGFDYMMMWQKSQPLNAVLLTTDNGVSLIGNKSIDLGRASGLRQWFGFFIDDEKRTGIEMSWFLMESRGVGSSFGSSATGLPSYNVPFLNGVTGVAGNYVISSPNNQIGSVNFGAQTQTYGIEANMITNLYRAEEGSGTGIDVLCGMRFFSLEERMHYNTTTTDITAAGAGLPFGGQPALAGATIRTTDSVRTFNEFYGANLGLRGEHSYGRLFFGWNAKFAAGYMNSYADANGASSINGGNVLAGGRYIEATDLGRHRDGGFAFLPEGGISIGYQVSQKIRFHVGYNYMYINRVIRPGSIYNQTVNGPTLPSDPSYGTVPARTFGHDMTKNSDYSLQGISFGLQIGF